MEQQNIPPPTPKDARKATGEQRELQEKLDHRKDDPDAPRPAPRSTPDR